MKKYSGWLLAALVAATMGLVASCDAAEELCGPCGDVYAGDDFISGDARLDGIFKAVGSFGSASAKIEGSFRTDLEALAEVFGVEGAAEMSIDDLVAEVKGSIEAELEANVSGSLKVEFVEPKCQADVSVSVSAQADCEVKAGCDISAECEAGEVAVHCEGGCTGGCSGNCTGGCQVEVSGECGGTCQGTCTVEGGLNCEGVCKGECEGTCSLENSAGECEGECVGTCHGSCKVEGGMSCEGSCHGKCEVEVEATCEGECHGSCDAECSGGCEGSVTPPSCSAEGSCDASADCQASASAQASANVECTPPSLDIRFEFAAAIATDVEAQAAFVAKMDEFKVRMVGIIQGMFKMRALIDADYAAELGFEPPLVQITGAVEALLEADLGSFDIPAGRLVCVFPAFEDSFDILSSAATDLVGTFQAQVEIVGVLNIL